MNALQLKRPELSVSISELMRHWSFIIDAILPHEGAIGVTKRGRPVVVLVAPWLWAATQRIGLDESAQLRGRVEALLRARFPRQFAKPIAFEVGSGWLGLVEDMLAEVDTVLRRHRRRITWARIFSKYASLRADFETSDFDKPWARDIEAIVQRYEAKSETRCERCGRPGSAIERGGWIYVVCEKHAR